MSRWIMASEGRVTETYSDLQGPLTKEGFERLMGSAESWHRRNAALVALCEELLGKYQRAQTTVAHEGCAAHSSLEALDEELADYRARLAKLKGAG
jgi:hypothetical protein